MLDHDHATVYLSLPPTARRLSPSRKASRLIYSVRFLDHELTCKALL